MTTEPQPSKADIDRAVKEYFDSRIREMQQQDKEAKEKKGGFFKKKKPDQSQATAQAQKPANGKAKKKGWIHKDRIDYSKFEHESDYTINLHAGNFTPKSEELNFIDPKAVALPSRGIPRLKLIIELMSKSAKKAPLPYIMIGIMAIIAVIAVSILYDRVIEPAADAERDYQLQLQRNGGNATGLQRPEPLFKFEPINPFSPPPP